MSQFIEMFDFENNSHDWPILSFCDFASLDCTMTTDYEYYSSYPHIGIDSIEQNTGRLFGYRTVKEDNVKSGKYVFTSNHIIYSKIRPNLNKVATPDFNGLCSADSYPILANEEVTSKEFLAYLMRSDVFLRYIVPLSNRTGMPKVNREQVEGFACPFPPKAEQDKFVAILHQADKSGFDGCKSQFIEMFDFENNSHDWPILSFCDFASLDCTMTTDYEYYSSYPHIGIDSIEQNTGRLFGYRTVKEDNVKSGKYVFTSNHIIYSKIRPNLNKVATPDFNGLCSADSYPILANEEVTSKEFLAYLMRSDVFLRYIVPLSNRTGMPKVNREQVEGFACPFPPKAEQDKFVAILHQADKSGSGTMFRLAS